MIQKKDERGFTIIELLWMMGLITILSATALYNLKSMSHALANASFEVEHFLRYGRSRAISGTEVVLIKAVSATRLEAYSSDSCTGTMTKIADMSTDLPVGTSFTDLTSSVCFTQRGLADLDASFPIADTHGHSHIVRVALGGGTKIDMP